MSLISNDTTDETPSTVELSPSERHALLVDERRRLVFDVLDGKTTSVDLKSLATGVVAREDGTPTDDDAVDRVSVLLHHVHLPRLAAAGIVDYDPESHLIEPPASTSAE